MYMYNLFIICVWNCNYNTLLLLLFFSYKVPTEIICFMWVSKRDQRMKERWKLWSNPRERERERWRFRERKSHLFIGFSLFCFLTSDYHLQLHPIEIKVRVGVLSILKFHVFFFFFFLKNVKMLYTTYIIARARHPLGENSKEVVKMRAPRVLKGKWGIGCWKRHL